MHQFGFLAFEIAVWIAIGGDALLLAYYFQYIVLSPHIPPR